MRVLLLTLALLTGCATTVPVTQKFPDAPGMQAMTACPQLQKLETIAQLTDVAKTVVANYTEYYICAIKLEAWINWYTQQQIIFKELN